VRHLAKLHADRSNSFRDNGDLSIFQNGGYLPPWICYTRVWTTHEENLVVVIITQNLVGIGEVVPTTCKFKYFAH